MGTDSLIIYTQDCIKLYGFILSFENQGQNIHLYLPYFRFFSLFFDGTKDEMKRCYYTSVRS